MTSRKVRYILNEKQYNEPRTNLTVTFKFASDVSKKFFFCVSLAVGSYLVDSAAILSQPDDFEGLLTKKFCLCRFHFSAPRSRAYAVLTMGKEVKVIELRRI